VNEIALPTLRANRVGSSREDLRIHNLSLVLSLVHKNVSLSRSDLAAQTRLNRSTVSDLVAELSERGLLLETERPQATGVGRPSHMVSVNNRVVAFAVEISTYAVRVAAVGLAGKVIDRRRAVTGLLPSPSRVVEIIVELVASIRSGLDKNSLIAGIGVSIPGQVNEQTGTLRMVTMLGWGEVELASMISAKTGLPVSLGNDGTISCVAERDFGAGRGFNDIVYIFGGAGGIGGGVIVGGQMLRGTAGFAGELGHMRISDSKIEDSAGLPGTLEALVKREDLLDALHLDDADDDELTRAILKSKSLRVRKLIERQIDLLGIAIANCVNIFNPEVVLLAGFLSSLFDADDYRLLAKARAGGLAGARERVVVRKAELGANLVLVGAAEIAFAGLLADPAGFKLRSPKSIK
jgi:predicted NBD/HSP70 family sugar kinase